MHGSKKSSQNKINFKLNENENTIYEIYEMSEISAQRKTQNSYIRKESFEINNVNVYNRKLETEKLHSK